METRHKIGDINAVLDTLKEAREETEVLLEDSVDAILYLDITEGIQDLEDLLEDELDELTEGSTIS